MFKKIYRIYLTLPYCDQNGIYTNKLKVEISNSSVTDPVKMKSKCQKKLKKKHLKASDLIFIIQRRHSMIAIVNLILLVNTNHYF